MRLVEILSEDRVVLTRGLELKSRALDALAALLARGTGVHDAAHVRAVLEEREGLQSTGIGDGVAIPHGFIGDLSTQVAALLVAPDGVPFESIDERPAKIILGVIGPKRANAQLEHLRILARASKVLRDASLRERILNAASAAALYEIVREADARVP
jgi:PTS system nitrogen regulatory IIA component